jgi:hypothetical protein
MEITPPFQSKGRVSLQVGATTLEIDMSKLYELDARKVQIGAANPATAPELMRAMEEGFSLSGQLHAMVIAKITEAENAVLQRRAEVILDIVPEVLKAKGLASARSPGGSEDHREAVLSLDREYQARREIVAALESIKELLKIHMRGFEMAYGAVKRVVENPQAFLFSSGGNDVQNVLKKPTQTHQAPTYSPSNTAAPQEDFGFAIGTPKY